MAKKKDSTKEKGDAAERVAEAFYLGMGFVVLARNFRLPLGEIDLVVKRGGDLCFVEVKGRAVFRDCEAWHPRWREKKRKLRRMAQIYLARHGAEIGDWAELRLDIVYVTQGRVSHRYEGEPFV